MVIGFLRNTDRPTPPPPPPGKLQMVIGFLRYTDTPTPPSPPGKLQMVIGFLRNTGMDPRQKAIGPKVHKKQSDQCLPCFLINLDKHFVTFCADKQKKKTCSEF